MRDIEKLILRAVEVRERVPPYATNRAIRESLSRFGEPRSRERVRQITAKLEKQGLLERVDLGRVGNGARWCFRRISR